MKIKWLVQTNLVQEDKLDALRTSCERLGMDFVGFKITPFAEDLKLPEDGAVYVPYGSTTLIKNFARSVLDKRGLFFKPENFRTSTWVAQLGGRVMNHDAMVLPLKDVPSFLAAHQPVTAQFMKPDDDLKDFTGGVMTVEEIVKFAGEAVAGQYPFPGDVKVVLAHPKNFGFEYRLFMVGETPVAWSSYKLRSLIRTDKPVPEQVLQFARETARIWRPAECFVMDVVATEVGYQVMEFNCINASGFYSCDIFEIVKAVTKHVDGLIYGS